MWGKSDALREYFEDHENGRIAAAVARERITLGDAARLADVDRWKMRDNHREHGVELRLGLVDEDDAAYEGKAASELEIDKTTANEWLSTWIDKMSYYVPYRSISEHR